MTLAVKYWYTTFYDSILHITVFPFFLFAMKTSTFFIYQRLIWQCIIIKVTPYTVLGSPSSLRKKGLTR